MEALSEPLFEISKESGTYQDRKYVRDHEGHMNNILKEIAKENGFDSKDFVYYGPMGFGFNKSHEAFRDELMKNPDRNGVYLFKKRSAAYKRIHPKMLEIEEIRRRINPFELHDLCGLNNVRALQWLGDRLFVEVKSKALSLKEIDQTEERKRKYGMEPLIQIPYTEYLQLLIHHAEGKK